MLTKTKLPPLEIIETNVNGTSRQRVRSSGGTVLDRQNVYLKSEVWEELSALAKYHGVSGSVVIARLIREASRRNQSRCQAR